MSGPITAERMGRRISRLCASAEIQSDTFARWCATIDHQPIEHRKVWEWVFILDELNSAGVAVPGSRGLGFGVGNEPLAAVLAARGSSIVATDLDPEAATAAEWAETGQHAAEQAALNAKGLCPPDEFDRLVTFRPVDMNGIPTDLRDFDFVWSSCALEHLGSLEAGLEFIHRSLDCLRPGGVAVHTTEFNVGSNRRTVKIGGTVLYRRRDMEQLAASLTADGHDITLDLRVGDQPADQHVDAPPFSGPHLRVKLGRYVTTSVGLVVTKAR